MTLGVVLLLALPLRAGEVAFPQAFSATVSRGLSAEAFYGSKVLASLQSQVSALASVPDPRVAADLLAKTADLKTAKQALAAGTLAPERVSALIAANALARPDQIPAVLDGLETAKPGLGKAAADILAKADGDGDRRVIAALRAAGRREPRSEFGLYGRDGRWETFFDNAVEPKVFAGAEPAAVDARGAVTSSKPRPSGLQPSTKR